jgi:hypothetical protein
MPIPAFESVPDAQGNLNFKMYTDAAVAVPLLQSENAAAHANRVNVMAEGLLAAWGDRLVSVDIVESVAAQKLLTGRDSMGISEAVAMAQMFMKGAQTTPPVTPVK